MRFGIGIALGGAVGAIALACSVPATRGAPAPSLAAASLTVPDIARLPDDEAGRLVRRGRDLVAHTADRIGPGTARAYSGNGLDCQSCHIEAGTRAFALPLVAAYADYPQYRARSGRVETIADRVNGCMMRSLNGRPLPIDGPEMTAIVAYLRFLSSAGASSFGRGTGQIAELSRPADPQRGSGIYARVCAACHGVDGAGQKSDEGKGYAVPPLWGRDSFNDGAGMARLIQAANFIHAQMPPGGPGLAGEDAWDVAAYVEGHPRPRKADLDADYPDRRTKPVDAPYGPYPDGFDARQHRFGPFAPIRQGHDGKGM